MAIPVRTGFRFIFGVAKVVTVLIPATLFENYFLNLFLPEIVIAFPISISKSNLSLADDLLSGKPFKKGRKCTSDDQNGQTFERIVMNNPRFRFIERGK